MSKDHPKVLIVEDEAPLANALSIHLGKHDIATEVVATGAEALALLNQNTFALVLLDLVMPDTDGFAVLEEMKARGVTTPVIVVSNLAQTKDIERAQALGAVDYVVKSDVQLADVHKKIIERITPKDY